MSTPVRKFSGERFPRVRGIDELLDSKADAGEVGQSGLTAAAGSLVGNPRGGESDVQSLVVEGLVEFEEGIFRVLADALTSEGLGQFAETSSADLADVLSDETGYSTGAVAVFSKTPTIETPAIIGRITRNGHWVTPFINVQADHGASGVAGEDQTTEVAAAVQEANETGRELIFPAGIYDVTTIPEISTNGVIVRGHGQNATYIRHTSTTGSTLKFTNQFPQVRDLTLWPTVWKTGTSCEIEFDGCYRGVIEDVYFQYHNNGILLNNCATPAINGCTMLYAHGGYNIKLVGTAAVGTFGTYIDHLITNNQVYVAYGVYRAWTLSTAFTAGEVTVANGYCWQCITSGTTAGSGTLTPPTSNSYDWTLAAGNVTHGTAVFRAFQSDSLAGILMDNYAYSLSMKTVGLINGVYGVRMTDTANTGSSYPMWIASSDLQIDHAFTAGVFLEAGLDVNLGTGAWISSTIVGAGITVGSSFQGVFKMLGGRIAFNGATGILIGGGEDYQISHNAIIGNGTLSTGTYNGIFVVADVEDFDISHNVFGDENGLGTNYTYAGIIVDTGSSDNYVIAHNRGRGLSSGLTVIDGGTGVDKSVFHNLPLTRNEPELFVVSGTTHTLAGSTDAIRFDPSGACTVTMLSGAQYQGKIVDFYNITTNTVSSASSNIGPLAGGAASTAILPGTAGSYARLKYNADDDIWYIIAAG